MDHASLIVQRSDDRRSFVTRENRSETLIVPVTGQAMDLDSIYVLNPVGSRIWELLREPTTAIGSPASSRTNSACRRRTRRPIPPSFLGTLSTRGLIQERPGRMTPWRP